MYSYINYGRHQKIQFGFICGFARVYVLRMVISSAFYTS